MISAEYFSVLSIPVVRGRGFDARDINGAAPVAIVNAAMAKKYWPTEEALGRRLNIGKGLGPEFEEATRESSVSSATCAKTDWIVRHRR